MTDSDGVVLDASALLAYLFLEPGAERVKEALEKRAFISAVNYAEVLTKLSDVGHRVDQAVRLLRDHGLTGAAFQVVSVDTRQAEEIARLRQKTKKPGLSLGDRACLALAHTLQLPVLTTAQAWKTLKVGLEVIIIR